MTLTDRDVKRIEVIGRLYVPDEHILPYGPDQAGSVENFKKFLKSIEEQKEQGGQWYDEEGPLPLEGEQDG